MQRFLQGFCCGALLLSLPWPAAPGWPVLVGFLVAGVLGSWFGLAVLMTRLGVRSGRLSLGAGALLGILWSISAHGQALASRHVDSPTGDAVAITIEVISEPVVLSGPAHQGPAIRFQARVAPPPTAAPRERARPGAIAYGAVVRLSWYGAPTVMRGDVWTLRAVLRSPWSYANPGGFDYERWLFAAGIDATGYVRTGTLQARPAPGPLQRFRGFLQQALGNSGLPRQGILLALLTGDSGGISEQQWDTFRVTGTVHLMVISGLHVGLAAGLGFAVGRWLCLLYPPVALWLDGRKAGCIGGLTLAAGYVSVAGAGLPATRALVMAAGVLALLAWGRNGALGRTLVLALATLLLLQPLAIHQQGFWLSFGAVGILLLTLGRRQGREGRVLGLLRPQLALSLGMLPAVALFTGDLPWAGVPANLLAIPLVSLCVVPATLLGGVLAGISPVAAAAALWVADRVLGVVLVWLDWLARAPPLNGAGAVQGLLLAQAAALWWLLGPPRRHLPVLALCLALPFAQRLPDLAPGEYRVMALDVGQGAATVIDTRRHRLLFDAGPGFPSGFETGSSVVVPSVLASGSATVNAMVLSHDHLDHVGGASAVRRGLRVQRLLATTPTADADSCHGHDWRWDGVRFRLLDLPRPPGASENDRSCVLLVDDGRFRTLLGGDIGARVEAVLLRALLAEQPACQQHSSSCDDAVRVHLVFAPHHGSATSSSPAMVRVLAPQLVFVEAGRNNRFGHPHPLVAQRYQRIGARLYQTGRHGALVWRSGEPLRVVRWRQDRSPYWRSQEALP
ncbi:MAG: DNA internalization-related competence protein ComEC/Rec2 [Pseudomonadales bacterium]